MPLASHHGKCRAVDSQPGERVCVDDPCDLFDREGLREALHQHTGVVHDDIQASMLSDDMVNRSAAFDL